MTSVSDKITLSQIAAAGGSIETREPRGRGRMPSFTQIVVVPAVFVGLLFCGVSFSASLAAVSMYPEWLVISQVETTGLFVFAFALAAGCLATLAIASWQLGNWNALQRGLKKVTLNARPVREERRARVMTQTSPRSWDVGRYEWGGELSKMARLFHNQRGEWVGPDRLTRSQLTGTVRNLTENYPDIVGDLVAWGWLDSNNNWTGLGKAGLRAKLQFMSDRKS